MYRSKYSNFLTIVLVLAILIIIGIAIFLAINIYKKHINNKDAANAIIEFESNISNKVEDNSEIELNQNIVLEQNIVDESNKSNASNSGVRKVTYYKNFVMIGYIEIPSIKIKYPVLEKETVSSLEKSVAVRYPENAILNEIGNVVIVGHNYRNGMFFSNLKKLSVKDKIKITDSNGQTLIYTVYEKYETTPEDVSYITRDVGNNKEITLVTCTDDSKLRLIVKARV